MVAVARECWEVLQVTFLGELISLHEHPALFIDAMERDPGFLELCRELARPNCKRKFVSGNLQSISVLPTECECEEHNETSRLVSGWITQIQKKQARERSVFAG